MLKDATSAIADSETGYLSEIAAEKAMRLGFSQSPLLSSC